MHIALLCRPLKLLLHDQLCAAYYELMENYTARPGDYPNVRRCDPAKGERSNINYVCLFDVTQFIPEECLAKNKYGFATGKPCIFLRPNKVRPQSSVFLRLNKMYSIHNILISPEAADPMLFVYAARFYVVHTRHRDMFSFV